MSIKKLRFTSSLCFLVVLCVVFSFTSSDAQKRRPGSTITVQDSLAQADSSKIDQRLLPSLRLREYTITGTQRIRILPSQRNPIETRDYTRRESALSIEGRSDRSAPGVKGAKEERAMDVPVTGIVNEAYFSAGKYADINAGVKYRRKFPKNELYTDIDIRTSSGHVDYADYYSINGTVGEVRPLTGRILNKAQLAFNAQQYKFYGSIPDPERKRSGYFVDFSDAMDILQWDAVYLSLEGGGRYFDPDTSQYFNWNLWTRLNINSMIGSTFITGTFELNTDRVKDSASGNAPVNDANFGMARVAVERLFSPRFHLKVGAAYYHTFTKNANFVLKNQNNVLVATGPFEFDEKANKVYPQIALTYDFGEPGRFFIEYEPTVAPFTLLERLKYNQYLNLTSPLSYEDLKQSIKIGWSRSYVHDLSFEIFYNDRRIDKYGILIDNAVLDNAKQGMWFYSFDNVIDANEYRGIINWNPDPRFSAWTSLSYTEYTVRESDFAASVPYVPNFTGEVSLQFLPGWGLQFILDGQYIDKRDTGLKTDAFGQIEETETLEDYFMMNFTVSKQWNRNLNSYMYFYNLLNEEYQMWHRYYAPDFVGGAGIRYFW
ncbi:hypothetical protein ACFL6L_03985 [candidate division KSB1 bacterium]